MKPRRGSCSAPTITVGCMTTNRVETTRTTRRTVLAAAVVCLAVSVSTVVAMQQTLTVSRVRDAEAVLDAMVAGDFSAIVARFDATLKTAVTEQTLRSSWATLGTQIGKFIKRAPGREEPTGKYIAVLIPCEFERGQLVLTVVFDAAGAIAGVSMRPPTAPYASPPYASPGSYTEREVTVGTGEWALPGTLTLPIGDGPFPAVVLVHGSGANDRDETYGPNKVFKDVALGLASQGVAVLRYDKRTFVHGRKAIDVTQFTVKEETIDDALAAAALLRNEAVIDKRHVFVLGHSLGGMLAPRIAAADPTLAGFIVMAGAVRPLATATLDQYEYLFGADGTISDAEQKMINDAKKLIADVAALTDADFNSGRMLGNAPASYW